MILNTNNNNNSNDYNNNHIATQGPAARAPTSAEPRRRGRGSQVRSMLWVGYVGTTASGNIPEESNINQSRVFLVEQKFRGVWVLNPSKVSHLNLSPRKSVSRKTWRAPVDDGNVRAAAR